MNFQKNNHSLFRDNKFIALDLIDMFENFATMI